MSTLMKNPILKGFYPDPSICVVEEDFYLVNSTFAYFPGVPIFHSKDLVNWNQIGNVLDRNSQVNLNDIEHSQGIYAPTIRYNNGTYYLITTNVTRGGNFIVTSQNPSGPWSDPYIIEGAEGIDPSLFFDEDGRAYYIGTRPNRKGVKYNGDWYIWIQEIDLINMKLVGESHDVWNGAMKNVIWPEGPHLYKKDGYYYLMIAEGGTGPDHCITIARSKFIYGEYENNPRNPIITHRHLGKDYPIKHVGHGDLVRTKDDEWFIVMLASRQVDGHCNLGRETFLAKVDWEDGWPIINKGKGILQLEQEIPTNEFKIEDKEKCYHFYGDRLDHRFLFLRNPSNNLYSLTERKGALRLYLKEENLNDLGNPAYIGLRQEEYKFLASTMIEFEPKNEHESAGLAIIQSNNYNLRFEYSIVNKDKVLRIIALKDGKEEVVKQVFLDSENVFLKIIGRDLKLDFYYSNDGIKYYLLEEGFDIRYLSTEVAGGFVGCTIGMFATSNGVKSKNYADFLWFEYNNI
ncbi:glycoside hydrolase family 43 protein [Clostridium sp. DSM 100503]|uniref:glycoside hydrolase family 43 protein n=1 Tax=Clostridium sp. DSM 100503 TaxID=2963282 RepID=UPI002149C3C6|nr:glycoside hydrolase family 43 protein [Clostridium sp. DSM 100503]MCR1950736.1 glycoside hydrolase family 43 protein [Clostridium sp. DSM 100503]